MFDWDEKPELNITPLVDIMLVLLAILMVTAPTIIYEEQITLPKGSKTKVAQKTDTLELRIDKSRTIYMKKSRYTFGDFADNFLLATESIDKESPVFIRADEGLAYGDIMFVLKSVKEAGFSKVSLLTDGK